MTDDITNTIWNRHRAWLAPVLIIALALVVRLIYLNQMDSSPTSRQPIMDEKYHVHLAQQINSPEGLPDEPYYRAPLYPHMLALLLGVTDDSYYGVRLVQIILGSLLPLLVYLFGLRLFSRRIAYWAAVLSALWPTFIYYDSALLITSTMTLLTCLLVLQLFRCEDRPLKMTGFVLAGVLLGVAGLARPNILLLGPALLVWIWWVVKPQLGTKPALLRFLLIGACAFIVVLPVTVRNYVVADDLVFIAWQGGYNFFVGNNQQSTGWSATVPGIDATWEGGYKEAVAMAEQTEGRSLKRSEVSDFWYRAGWREIGDHPSTFFGLLFRKLRLFLNGYEIPNNQNIYLARQLSPLMQPLLFTKLIYFPYGLLAPLAVIGFVLSLSQWRRFMLIYLVIGSYLATLLLFFVCARFRQPMMPFMILFAVYGGSRIIEFVRRRQGKNLALALFMLVLLLAESNHDALGLDSSRTAAEDRFVIGNAYLAENNLAAAEMQYKRALASDSTLAPAYNNLGLISTRRNRIAEAKRYFDHSMQVDPAYLDSYLNMASALLETGQPLAAVNILQQAAVRHPLNDLLYLKLGGALAEAGRSDEALVAIRRCLQLNPANDRARDVLQQIQSYAPAP